MDSIFIDQTREFWLELFHGLEVHAVLLSDEVQGVMRRDTKGQLDIEAPNVRNFVRRPMPKKGEHAVDVIDKFGIAGEDREAVLKVNGVQKAKM